METAQWALPGCHRGVEKLAEAEEVAREEDEEARYHSAQEEHAATEGKA